MTIIPPQTWPHKLDQTRRNHSVRKATGESRRLDFTGSINKILLFFLLLALSVRSLPTDWTEGLHIGPFSLAGSFFPAVALAFTLLITVGSSQNWVSLAGWFGLATMSIVGATNAIANSRTGSLFSDIFNFAAVPIAATWALRTDNKTRITFLILLYYSNWLLLAITNLALLTHILMPYFFGSRVYVYSEFESTWILSVIAPYLYFETLLGAGKIQVILCRWSLLATVTILTVTTIVSSTRSVLIQLGLCLVFLTWGELRNKTKDLKWVVLSLTGLIAGFMFEQFAGGQYDYTLTLDRLTATQLDHEERLEEVEALLDQYGSDLILGKGLGSEFNSVTFHEGNNVTTAPHIAIVTLLMKGGVIAFTIGIILPLFWCLLKMFSSSSIQVFTSCAAVFMYLIFSSISGGWEFSMLFLYAYFLSLSMQLDRSRLCARLPGRTSR